MAQFRALIQGSRGPASRLGTKRSNMYVTVQSWSGQINVVMWHSDQLSEDMVRVTLSPHGHAADTHPCVCLYEGPCDGWSARLAMTAVRVANKQMIDQSERDRRRIAKLTRDNHVTSGVKS